MQKHDGGRIVVVACKSMEEVKWCHEGVVAAQQWQRCDLATLVAFGLSLAELVALSLAELTI